MRDTSQTEVVNRAPVDASGVLRANTKIVVGSAIVVWCGMSAYWVYDSLMSEIGIAITFLTSMILGVVLGYRAQRLVGVRPLAAALGVAWRIGIVWVVLAAIIEYVTTDHTATLTINKFPEILLPHMFLLAIMFIIGYGAGVVRSSTAKMSTRDIISVIGALISLAGLIATIVFGVVTLPMSDMKSAGAAREPSATIDSNSN